MCWYIGLIEHLKEISAKLVFFHVKFYNFSQNVLQLARAVKNRLFFIFIHTKMKFRHFAGINLGQYRFFLGFRQHGSTFCYFWCLYTFLHGYTFYFIKIFTIIITTDNIIAIIRIINPKLYKLFLFIIISSFSS